MSHSSTMPTAPCSPQPQTGTVSQAPPHPFLPPKVFMFSFPCKRPSSTEPLHRLPSGAQDTGSAHTQVVGQGSTFDLVMGRDQTNTEH